MDNLCRQALRPLLVGAGTPKYGPGPVNLALRQTSGASPTRLSMAVIVAAGLAMGVPARARGQDEPAPPAQPQPAQDLSPFDDRPISQVRIEGLSRQPESFVRNQLRTEAGKPFRSRTVTEDIQRLYRTGAFRRVDARVESLEDRTVVVVFDLGEAAIVQDVQVVGNRSVNDQELAKVVGLLKGTPVDEFQLGRTRRAIEDLYRNKGYYLVRVTIDESELERNGIVLFRIREGDRLKVTDIRFRGNRTFSPDELRTDLRTKTAGLFETGPLDNTVLEQDVATLARFHRDRGYLDVRTDREITPSPDGKEAIVTFLIDEGPRYTLRRVDIVSGQRDLPAEELAISVEQALGLIELKPGDVYGEAGRRRSQRALLEALWRLGYPDARVDTSELRDIDRPLVDLRITMSQGAQVRAGEVIVKGNSITKSSVILRQAEVLPDKPLDINKINETRRRLVSTRLFAGDQTSGQGGVTVTPQAESPDNPGYRDVLVEVVESNTGAISFGAAVSSDSGVVGTIGLTQRNFDLFDVPSSWDEFLSGRAFRGAQQTLDLQAAPGTEVSNYSISLADPYIFDSDYSASGAAYYRDRDYDQYDERRFGGRVRVGRQFGDIWTGGVSFRAERVKLSDIEADAPVDVFEAEGPDTILGAGVFLTRTTVPVSERLNPGRGARTELSAEQVFGDYTFTKMGVEHQFWLTLYQDFLERRSTLGFKIASYYIPQDYGEAPVYERYYLGGRSFRGFDFRGVSPRGIRADTGELGDDPVGGNWSFFAGVEYLQPVWGNVDGRPVIGFVVFTDTGTVEKELGFSQYRVSVGAGLRLLLPISPIPLAFDFGYPILKEDGDETEVFSFSVDLPF